MSRRTDAIPRREAIAELRDAEDCLYAAANELARVRPKDPMADECAAIAQQCDAAAKVLEARAKK